MLAWLNRLLNPPTPWRRIAADLNDRLEALEGRREKDRADFKELRGYVYALKRRGSAVQEPSGDAIEEPVDPRYSPRPVTPTAGLARRFKLGG